MSQPLRRYQIHTERRDDYAKIGRITSTPSPRTAMIGTGPAGGDNQQLRGIPAIGRGVTGAINGTTP